VFFLTFPFIELIRTWEQLSRNSRGSANALEVRAGSDPSDTSGEECAIAIVGVAVGLYIVVRGAMSLVNCLIETVEHPGP
jgi:hypothetical protein